MRDSSSNTGPNPSSMTLSRRLHIWTPMCDFGISVPPWASAAVTGPARVAAPTATVEPASPRRNTRRSMLLLPMVVSSVGGRRQGRDADVPEADRVLRAVVLQADEPAQPVPSGGRDVLVDEHAVAEDGVVPAGHPDLQVVPGALRRGVGTGQVDRVDPADRAGLVRVATGTVQELHLHAVPGAPEADGHSAVGAPGSWRVVTPLQLQREVLVRPLGVPEQARPTGAGEHAATGQGEAAGAGMLPPVQRMRRAVEDRTVAALRVGPADAGTRGGHDEPRPLPCRDPALEPEPVGDRPDVPDERAVGGPRALVLDQVVDGAATADHPVAHAAVERAHPHRGPGDRYLAPGARTTRNDTLCGVAVLPALSVARWVTVCRPGWLTVTGAAYCA